MSTPRRALSIALLGVSVTIAYFVAMVGGAIAVWRPRRPDEDAGAAPGSGSSAA